MDEDYYDGDDSDHAWDEGSEDPAPDDAEEDFAPDDATLEHDVCEAEVLRDDVPATAPSCRKGALAADPVA